MRYRSRTDIITMILDSARPGISKTRIMYTAYLSYFQLGQYLKYLIENELLELEAGTQLYRPTEKGLKFLNMSYDLNEMLALPNPKINRNFFS